MIPAVENQKWTSFFGSLASLFKDKTGVKIDGEVLRQAAKAVAVYGYLKNFKP